MKFIDLTQSFSAKTPVFPGDPPLVFEPCAHLAKDGYNDHRVTMQMHVGTHMDAPLHMIANGKRMAEISVDRFMGPGVVIDARGKAVIDADLLTGMKIPEGAIVLVATGYDKKYGKDEYFTTCPVVTEAFAAELVKAKVKMLCLDTAGPDQPPYPVHKLLLGNEILIVENCANLMELLSVPAFDVYAFPAKWETDAAPVRVIAVER